MLRSMLPCIRPLMAGTLPASLQAAFPGMTQRLLHLQDRINRSFSHQPLLTDNLSVLVPD